MPLLATAFGKALPSRNLHLVELPSNLDDEFINALVIASNRDVPIGEPPRAVWVVSGDVAPTLPRVHQNQAEEYRVGDRVFVFRHGEYAPLSSMLNSAAPLVGPIFPLGESDGELVSVLAASIAAIAGLGERGERTCGAVEQVLVSLARVAQRTATGESDWVITWWDAAARFVETLAEVINHEPTGQSISAEAIAACASIPVGVVSVEDGTLSIDEGELSTLVATLASTGKREDALGRLSSAGATAGLPMLRLDEIDRQIIAGMHPLEAISLAPSANNQTAFSRQQSWLETTKEQLQVALHPKPVHIKYRAQVAGEELPSLGESAYLLTPHLVEWAQTATKFTASVRLELLVEGEEADATKPATSALSVKPRRLGNSTIPNIHWESAANGAKAVVILELAMASSALQPEKLTLQFAAPTLTPAAGSIALYVAPPHASMVLVGTGRVPVKATWGVRGSADGDEELLLDTPIQKARLLLCPSRATVTSARFAVDGEEMSLHPAGCHVIDAHVMDGTTITMRIGDATHPFALFRQRASERPEYWLPLESAFFAEAPSRDPLPEEVLRTDVRAHYEEAFRRQLQSLGTRRLPYPFTWIASSTETRKSTTPILNESGVMWAASVPSNSQLDPSALERLLGRPQATSFANALTRLIEAIELAEPGVTRSFAMSRWSLREVPSSVVDAYLGAWTGLCSAAVEAERFWCLFPFSIVIADETGSPCAAMLSPLHPIRLAWLHSLESALCEVGELGAGSYPRLLQMVEGWNFPALATGVGDTMAPLNFVAARLSAGSHRLFLGWSALAEVQGAKGRLPDSVAGWTVPAGGTSGLSGGAVAGAVREYLRVHNYKQAVSVDLFSAARVARSTELDAALMEQIAAYAAGSSPDLRRLKFFRVTDTERRFGNPPESLDILQRIARVDGSTARPFNWTVLPENQNEPLPVDLRFVEDAHTRVQAGDGGAFAGSCPAIPLRRSFVRERKADGRVLLHAAGVVADWSTMTDALRQFEAPISGRPMLRVEANAAHSGIAGSGAEWIVTGAAYFDPSQVAQSLDGDRLLWEWRPAVAARLSSDELLAGRPYVTITRVPQPLLQKLTGYEGVNGSIDRATQVLQELGRRGVGLASLISAGGNQVDGALGFFLAFQLLDCAAIALQHEREAFLVLPIDAVHGILEAVAQPSELEKGGRKADLIVLTLSEAEDGRCRLTLTPVEVRASNMRAVAAPAPFPLASSSEVLGKVEQAAATVRLLRSVVERYVAPGAMAHVAATALMSLVEATIACVPSTVDSHIQELVMRTLASHECEVQVSSGLLLWFQRDTSVDGVQEGEHASHRIVMVNPVLGGRDLWAKNGGTATQVVASALTSLRVAALVFRREREGPTLKAPEPPLPHGVSALRDAEDAAPAGGATQALVDALGNSLDSDQGGIEEVDWPSPLSHADSAAPRDRARLEGNEGPTHAEPAQAKSPNAGSPVADRVGEAPDGKSSESKIEPRALIGTTPSETLIEWAPLDPRKPLPNAHMVIVGAAGSGKTQAIKGILKEMSERGVSTLVLDFKDDYTDDETIKTLGSLLWDVRKGLPFNPLALPEGQVQVLDIVYSLKGILEKVYSLGDQQAVALKSAIEQAYGSAGLSLNASASESGGAVAPTMAAVRTILQGSGTANSALLNRLSALFDFDLFKPDAAGFQAMLKGPGVIRFTGLPQEELKSATAALVLRALYLHLQRLGHSGGKLRLLLVIDEAHRVANMEEVRLLVKEARAYGVGVMLATQEATDLDDFAFSNAGTLLSMKLAASAQADRVAKMLSSDTADAGKVADVLRSLPQFEAIIRNDHYMPNRRLKVIPFYARRSSSGHEGTA